MVFADRRRHSHAERDALLHRLIQAASTAFWDAYLKNDAEAKAWLAGPGLSRRPGQNRARWKRSY